MRLTHLFKKGALVALFFFLSGCSNECPSWRNENIQSSSCPSYSIKKVYFPTKNNLSGLELEIADSLTGLRMYLNSFSTILPAEEDDAHQTNVTYIVADQRYQAAAYRMEGGQRLLLPNDATEQILDALWDQQTVEFQVGRYKAVVDPDGFREAYSVIDKN